MVWVGFLEESLELVYWRPRLALNFVPDDHDVLHAKAVHLFVIIIVVNRGCNPLRAPPLLTTLGVLLGALDGDVGRHCFVAVRDYFPTTGDGERLGRLIDVGILGSDAEQLLSGVPDNVIRCLEGWRLVRVMYPAPGHLWPWSLRTTALSLLVTMSALARVPCMAFGLHAHVPLTSLATCLGFGALALLPWQGLGQNPSRQ
jgi:hypothetical protein